MLQGEQAGAPKQGSQRCALIRGWGTHEKGGGKKHILSGLSSWNESADKEKWYRHSNPSKSSLRPTTSSWLGGPEAHSGVWGREYVKENANPSAALTTESRGGPRASLGVEWLAVA